jgi:hypothetical protein
LAADSGDLPSSGSFDSANDHGSGFEKEHLPPFCWTIKNIGYERRDTVQRKIKIQEYDLTDQPI